MKILHIVGARPNFMKVAPLMRAFRAAGFAQTLVHTNQHYDDQMSQIFFEELGLPLPDYQLQVGAGSHAQQTARIMERFEPVLAEQRPDWLFVVGDVNSTLACALVAAKMGIPVAHVEAGLRAYDRTMPEEINRVLTDHLADKLFTPSEDADQNLDREGIAPDKIHRVGNIMIDTLVYLRPHMAAAWEGLHGIPPKYVLVTLHRPANVDDPAMLGAILRQLEHISQDIPVLFPLHPRTRQQIGTLNQHRITFMEPQGYLAFLALQANAAAVITDSGGVQEETTFLNIPCLTLRPNTERPITITLGTNQLVTLENLVEQLSGVLAAPHRDKPPLPLWDGQTAQRIVAVMRG